jgi:hypothetical protein
MPVWGSDHAVAVPHNREGKFRTGDRDPRPVTICNSVGSRANWSGRAIKA